MPFTPAQTRALLAQKGIGSAVLARLQQMGLDNVRALAGADVDDMLQQGAALSGSVCWQNSPQARAAMTTAVAWAQAQQRETP